MTYCLGIMTHEGLVLASDSRTNAGSDDVSVYPKMHSFVQPGKRVFVLLSSGSLSLSQSVVTLLRRDFEQGTGLASASTMYDAARVVGEQVRAVSELDRPALGRDGYRYNIHFILGGQILGERHGLYLVYPQGNPQAAAGLRQLAKFAERLHRQVAKVDILSHFLDSPVRPTGVVSQRRSIKPTRRRRFANVHPGVPARCRMEAADCEPRSRPPLGSHCLGFVRLAGTQAFPLRRSVLPARARQTAKEGVRR